MARPHIVALTGIAGAGKTSAAHYLVAQHGFVVEKFAGPLKDMLRAIGLTEDEIEGDLKHEPCDLLMNRTPRHAMQTLGTEWGRDQIDPNFWVNLWAARCAQRRLVVVDDCRFPNEAQAVYELGGRIIKIIRPEHGNDEQVASHASESLIDKLPCDHILHNEGTLMELGRKVAQLAFS